MAVTVTDNRTTWDAADSTTNWTGGTVTLVTADPDPIEATGHIGNVVSSTTVDCYFASNPLSGLVNLTNKLIYAWALPLGAMDTLANGGVAILIGDGTNRVGYHLAGSDTAVFRHNSGQPTYQCLVWDEASRPATTTTRAGVLGNLNVTVIYQIGVMFKTLAKSKGGTANCFVDIIRILDTSVNNGCALTISGGTSGDPGTFAQIAAEDSSVANVKAHGVVRLLGSGAVGVQGPLRFGDTASGSSWFEDTNTTVVFEDRGLAASRYKIFITDNGTGTTTFRLGTKVGSGITATGANGVTITGGSNVNWQFDASTDTDVTDVFIYGSTFNRATQGVSFRSGHEFIGGIISASGAITLNGATFVNNSVVGSTVAADASAVIWDVATDPDTFLHGTSITKGTNAHHAIEFGTTSPTSMTIRDMNFTSFTNTIGDNAAPLYIKRTTGTVNITASGCSGLTSSGYKTDGATVVIATSSRTVKISVVTTAGVAVTGANVFLAAASGGPFPHEDTVTISRTGTTATVTHTAHGLATNDQVLISDILNEPDDIGVHSITYINANSYSFTSANSGTLTYTGDPTITSTFVFLKGLANTGAGSNELSMSREIPSTQPVIGWARKADAAPFYKTGSVAGDVSSSADTSFSAVMVLDQ